jgi:hypothetical protein
LEPFICASSALTFMTLAALPVNVLGSMDELSGKESRHDRTDREHHVGRRLSL